MSRKGARNAGTGAKAVAFVAGMAWRTCARRIGDAGEVSGDVVVWLIGVVLRLTRVSAVECHVGRIASWVIWLVREDPAGVRVGALNRRTCDWTEI